MRSVCADIRDGREQLLPSKGRIQMSKTNHLQIVTSGLHRTAGPYICAISDQRAVQQFGEAKPVVGSVSGGSLRPRMRLVSSWLMSTLPE